MDLELVLRRAVELGASDIHLKVERPPIVRRDGNLGVCPRDPGVKSFTEAEGLDVLGVASLSCAGRFANGRGFVPLGVG